MQDYLYSVIGIIAIVIHIVMHLPTMRRREGSSTAYKYYRYLLLAIFAYYITDAAWGILAGLNWIPALFVDTTVYYVAMAAAVISWNQYIIKYLDLKGFFAKFFQYAGTLFFVLEIGFLVVNFFYPCFFWFDQNDAYQAGTVRYAALYVQIALFFVSCLFTGNCALKSTGAVRRRNTAIFLFSAVMLAANYVQMLYPLLPVYAMGCLIGSCILYVYVIEDEREEYRGLLARERDLAEQASHAKTTFLFNMSHDIRTPMNAILGFTRMAKNHIDDRERALDSLEKIEASGGQLLKLINDVLEMSRIEAGKLELDEKPEDMRAFLNSINPMLSAAAVDKSIDYVLSVKELQDRYVWADAVHFSRVLVNLISNAIKYTPNGGKVSVVVEQLGPAENGTARYRASVTDTGIGISEEFLAHIFEEFSRERSATISKQQGTGLGLAIAKRIVDHMGGTITVTSKLGEGSTFVVTVPLRVETEEEIQQYHIEPEQVKQRKQVSQTALADRQVLLVEDNELNREIATEILSEFEMNVTAAEDGLIALNLLKERAEGRKVQDCFDFVLMDVQMPVMDGYTATRAIRALEQEQGQDSHIPIIAMTANVFAEDKANAARAGMDAHLPKPIEVSVLTETLYSFLKHEA